MKRSSLALGALLLVSNLLAGCASSGGKSGGDDGGSDGMQTSYCQAGATQSCFCLGAGQGTQVCRADGNSFGSCTGCSGDGGTTISDMQAGNPCGDCDGCCNGSTCVTYQNQSNTECGVAGTKCAACTSGDVCDGASGMCAQATNGCAGCGSGCCGTAAGGAATCFVNNSGQCGTGGGSCQACDHGTLCENGNCAEHIDPMTQFRVVVSATKIYNTDSSGSCWDYSFGCGQPDVQVCFSYDSASGTVSGCTTTVNDAPVDSGQDPSASTSTDSVSWDDADGLIKDTNGQVFYIPGSAFTAGKVLLYVQDVDDFFSGSNDLIGSTHLAAQSNYYSGYMVGAFQRVVSVNFALR